MPWLLVALENSHRLQDCADTRLSHSTGDADGSASCPLPTCPVSRPAGRQAGDGDGGEELQSPPSVEVGEAHAGTGRGVHCCNEEEYRRSGSSQCRLPSVIAQTSPGHHPAILPILRFLCLGGVQWAPPPRYPILPQPRVHGRSRRLKAGPVRDVACSSWEPAGL